MNENCDIHEPSTRTKYEYDAFGNLLNKTGTTPNEMLYRGEQWDSDLGLYYLRARYYNPQTGRFMSRDPNNPKIINADGYPIDPILLHKYLYAGGDPVNAIDPTGRGLFDTGTLTFKIVTVVTAVAFVSAEVGEVLDCVAEAIGSLLPSSIPSVSANSNGCAIKRHDEWPGASEGNPLGPARWPGVGDTGEAQ